MPAKKNTQATHTRRVAPFAPQEIKLDRDLFTLNASSDTAFAERHKPCDQYSKIIIWRGCILPKNIADTLPSSYPKEFLPRVVDGSFVFSNVSMAEFAEQLTHLRGIELPVVDRTGIQGVYDITLKSAARAMLETDGSSLRSLIQVQLGLKLVSAKNPIEVAIVDHAEKPSEN